MTDYLEKGVWGVFILLGMSVFVVSIAVAFSIGCDHIFQATEAYRRYNETKRKYACTDKAELSSKLGAWAECPHRDHKLIRAGKHILCKCERGLF